MKKYAASCEAALTELFTKYGELFEIWFDGGVRPPEEGGPRAREIIERLQPNAILFQGPKNARNVVRWVGNERGVAPYPCWAADSDTTQEDGTKEGRYCGDPNGRVWCPGECDVPLGPGKWMCTCTKDRYWTMDELMRIYDCSVGRNCNLLLNAAPQPDGLILESEMKTYAEFGRRIKGRYANRLAAASTRSPPRACDSPSRPPPRSRSSAISPHTATEACEEEKWQCKRITNHRRRAQKTPRGGD